MEKETDAVVALREAQQAEAKEIF
jgi:hypothetical protein